MQMLLPSHFKGKCGLQEEVSFFSIYIPGQALAWFSAHAVVP